MEYAGRETGLVSGTVGNVPRKEEVREHIFGTFGSRTKALHWLNRPNQIFGGKTPAEILETEPGAVENELVRIDHGIFV